MAFFDSIIFSVEADVANYIAQMQRVNTVNATTARNMSLLTKAINKLDDEGNVLQRTVTKLSKDGTKITESFKQTEDGLKTVTRTIDNAAVAAKKLRQSFFDLGAKSADSIKKAVNLPAILGTAGTSDKSKLAGAFVNFQNEAGKAEVSIRRSIQLFNELKTGTLGSITETERGVVKSLTNIINLVETTNNKLAKAKTNATTTASNTIKFANAQDLVKQLRSDLVPVQLRKLLSDAQNAKLNAAFTSAIKPIAASGITQNRLNILTQQLRDGTLQLKSLKESEVPAVKALTNIINTYNNMTAAVIKNNRSLEQNKEKLFQLGKAPVDALRATLLPTGSFKRGTDPAAQAKFETALAALQERIGKAGTSVKRLNELYIGLKTGALPAISSVERGVVKSLTAVIKSHEEATGAVNKFGTGFLLSWRSIGRLAAIQGLHRVVSELIALFGQARQEAIELANSINLIQTITLRTRESSDSWFKVIRKISDEFGSDINDVAKAAYEAIGNQITETTADTEKFVTQVLRLARVTQSTARDAGATIAGLLNAYQLSASEAERVSSILFKAVDLGSFTLNDVADRLGRLAPLANQLGVGIGEVSAAIAALSNEGRRADAAITILRATFQKILKPTEASAAFFEKFGFSSGRAMLQVEGFQGFIKALSQTIEKEGVDSLVKYFDELRGLEAGVSLTTTAFERLNSFIKEINELARKDYFTANIVAQEDAIRKISIEFNKFKNIFITFGRDSLIAFSKFNDIVEGLTARFKDLASFFVNSVVVQVGGGIVKLSNAVLGAKDSVNLLSAAIVVATNSMIAFKTAGAFLLTLFGGPIGKALQIAITAITAIISAIQTYLESSRLLVVNSIDNFIRSNKILLDELIEASKQATLKLTEDTANRIRRSKALVLTYINDLSELAEREKKLLQESAQDIEADIESSLKNRVERFKEYIKAIDKEIESISDKIEKNLKEIENVRSKSNARNFEATLKGKTPAEQFDLILKRVRELETALQQASNPEKLKSLFEEADKLLEDATNNQEKRLQEAQEKGKLSTATSSIQQIVKLSQLRNELADQYTNILAKGNEELKSQIPDLNKQKEIAAQLFGELKSLTREGLKIRIFNRETGDLNDTKETIRKMTSVVERLNSITRQLPDLSIGDFTSLTELQAGLLKDVNELGIREDVVKTFADSVNKLGEDLKKIETNIPEGIRNSLRELGIQGTKIGEVKTNAENLFNTLTREFGKTQERLIEARTAQINDSAFLQGLKFGLSQSAAGKTANSLAKEIPLDAKELDKLRFFMDRIQEAGNFDTLNLRSQELIKNALPELQNILDRGGQAEKLKAGLEEFRITIDKFGTLNSQIIGTNVKLETKLDLNISALDRNTIAITQLSNNLLGNFRLNNDNGQATGVNLGGVTVNVNGAAAPQLVANEVVKQINLQIRRGNVRIGEKNV